MKRTTMHAALALFLLAPASAMAQHFEAVDTIPWTSFGRFPAYPAAETRPTELFVEAGAMHDNNIFRSSRDANVAALRGDSDRSDNVTRLGAGIRHESRVFGRQRLRFEARGDQYNFDRNSELDHFAYALRGAWLWELTNDLSGAIGYDRTKRLVDLAQVQRPLKDMITEQHPYANAAYLLGPHVRLRAGVEQARAAHSENAFNTADVRANTVTFGTDFVTDLGNALGVEARRTQGNVPIIDVVGGVPVDNEFTEREVAGVATLVAGAQLRGTARLGHTERRHKEFPERNFTGTTGRLTADWTPLQKTGFEFAAYREPRTIVDIAASYVVVTGVSFGPRWAPREKLVFSALLVRENQVFRGDPSQIVLGTPQQRETVHTIRLGVGWEPKRFIQLSAGLEHGRRDSNVFLRDYSYTALMANAAWRF